MAAPKGHKRYGGGRKKGQLSPKTKEKLRDEAVLRELVRAQMEPMVEAQIAAARGFKYLMARNRSGGQFKRVTYDEAGKLDQEQQLIEVWEKDPSTPAFADLLNRAYGKPAERVQADLTHHVGPDLERILRGLKRAGNGHA